MSNNLQSLLIELAAVAPEVCKRLDKISKISPTDYLIGDYGFWFTAEGELIASPVDNIKKNVGGNYALAWLQDALQRVIEGKGWYWELRYWKPREKYQAEVEVATKSVWGDTATEALLAALIAAVKGE